MKGLQLLLASMGIKINPLEIESAWEHSKDALPQLARAFDELNATQKRIEKKIDELLEWKGEIDKTTKDLPLTIMNGGNETLN